MDGNITVEEITGYLILALGFSLLFIGLVVLWEKFKKPLLDSLTKRIPLLMKVNRDIVIKGLAAAGFILFSRKLIYYIPFDGVIQTKFSLWWINGKAHTFVFISIFFLFIIGLSMEMLKRDIDDLGCGVLLIGITLLAVILFFLLKTVFGNDSIIEFPIIGRHLILVIFAPLLDLKILCSGKYLGFLTSVLLGYFIVSVNKKYTPGIIRSHAHIMIASGLMFIIFVGFSFYKSLGNSGNWEQRLNNKLLSVSDESDMMDLLEAVHTIYQEKDQYETLEKIVWFIVKEEEPRWKKEIYQRVIDEVNTLTGFRGTRLLGKIILWIAGTGDIPRAISVAENIPVKEIRNNVLKEIREKIEKK